MVTALLHPARAFLTDRQDWEHPLYGLRAALLQAVERGLIDQAHAERLFHLAEEDVIQPESLTIRVRKLLAGV